MKSRSKLVAALAVSLTLPVATMMMAQQAGVGRNLARPEGPCDIYVAGGTPCVSAHSTTRALSAGYSGPLYQLKRESDGKTLDIGVVPPSATDAGGYADAAAQDAFCADALCVINVIYDQSGKGNHLYQAPPGISFQGPAKGGFDTQPIADMAPITIMGHKAYGVFIMPGMGFRNNNAAGLAINDEPEGMYSVFDGKHFDSGCCFDYGNAETHSRDDGPGTMENTYFGTSTTWGSGDGPGPWIMADMEAGVYSGYNARKNLTDPTIDSWRFVTAVVDGGGGNQWDLRGGNAQSGGLNTYYSGARPTSRENNRYFPMHKEGAVLMGTGGDNGNGSAGTFYEGVMTTGYPTEATTDKVQANVVAARYDVQRVSLSRVTTFSSGLSQDVTVTFTNTTGAPVTGVKLSLVPTQWGMLSEASTGTEKSFDDPVAPGASVSATFKISAPLNIAAGHISGKADWTHPTGGKQSDTVTTRVRSAPPLKINEVLLSNPTNQFVELYNASDAEVDISNWSLMSTPSQWASVTLAEIPAGTKIAPKGFFLLGQSASGLAAPAQKGDSVIQVRTAAAFAPGQEIDIDGEKRTIATLGTEATPPTTIFIPIVTGPWIKFPPGTTNLPVASAAGFVVGQKIGIDQGGSYEQATVTAVGKAATQTVLAVAAAKGDTHLKIAGTANMTAGDTLIVGTGSRKETVTVKAVISSVAEPANGRRGATAAPGEVELAAPIQIDHQATVDVSDVGTGISFTPATAFAHISGDAVQALGSGITLDKPLEAAHVYGAAVLNPKAATLGYKGLPAPNAWFGGALNQRAGSLALLDATGKVVVDAMVYGSQQSNSSGNGTIASPDLATLEGVQTQGGCIVVVPTLGRGGAPNAGVSRSAGRTTDGVDTDSGCTDFKLQTPTPGAPNGK